MEELFEQERNARTSGDIKKLEEIQQAILSNCHSEEEVISTLRLLINKRKQEPECIKKLIRNVFDTHRDIGFLKNLLSKVVEGRIFLEEERVDIAEYVKNALGNNIQESYALVKDIPVETFTTISDRKRNMFLFEQFRLALLLKKLDDAELTSRKVRRSFLTNEEKIIFLNYSILLKIAQNRFLEASELFLQLNEVDESKKYVAMGSLYCLMSSCLAEDRNIIDEKKSLLKKFFEFKNNDEAMRVYLKTFSSDLIIDFGTIDEISASISKYAGDVSQTLLETSIMEHNLFVISRFFSKIKIEQIVKVMNIEEENLIGFISEMVNEKYCNVKINQPQRLVFFGDKHWNDSVDDVLDKIVLVSHLIHKQSISDS
ncbi:uncharacterized protein VICG_02155 [Vittaforma corneae ATCC 50505]|uniref:PCI domain-containing protein n=1 Tax=Vittaforma corneae (strain ATCC 50505) TaxID=993615 RepID=L2GIV0_VITCO|nr:uncharacterized protein VICG_02155 [Vittaforma corneae ATCC 50505]ELA40808.1 hypothetical protein VICG_02155 [Vittaforma corneae ATCC 50505]